MADAQGTSLREFPLGPKTMRRPRAIVFEGDAAGRDVLKHFLVMREYEVLTRIAPGSLCGVHGVDRGFCHGNDRCCDILIVDIDMLGSDDFDLLEQQARKGCTLDNGNKLITSGRVDDVSRERMLQLGCSLLPKPFTLEAFSSWLAGCERRFDLNQPLATRRREERLEGSREITFTVDAGGDVHDGVIVNMSPSGLCLKVYLPIAKEQNIIVAGSHFPSTRQATVRWVRQIAKGAFLTGIHCAPVASVPPAAVTD